ncbi:MAG: response regulator [Deltaproteobacteria bacterium]|nr:response regulator [Deltaproteobacteria bacterium]
MATQDDTPLTPAFEASPGAKPKLHILLAEDNFINQQMTRATLTKKGHTVIIAANGIEVLEALAKDHFDLILMDVQMPDMDGIQATAAIREIEKQTGEHIRIVALTAHAFEEDRDKCLAAGMDDYLAKPVRSSELLKNIENGGTCSVLAPDTAPDVPVDLRDFENRCSGDQRLIGQLIQLFFQNYHKYLADIREAMDRRDPRDLEYRAHFLKGVLTNFSARPARIIAARLEEMAKDEKLNDVESVYAALEEQMARVRLCLEAVITPTPGPC